MRVNAERERGTERACWYRLWNWCMTDWCCLKYIWRERCQEAADYSRDFRCIQLPAVNENVFASSWENVRENVWICVFNECAATTCSGVHRETEEAQSHSFKHKNTSKRKQVVLELVARPGRKSVHLSEGHRGQESLGNTLRWGKGGDKGHTV